MLDPKVHRLHILPSFCKNVSTFYHPTEVDIILSLLVLLLGTGFPPKNSRLPQK